MEINKLSDLLIFIIFSINFISAIEFTSNILDSRQANSNPSIIIDKTNGIKHLFWTAEGELVYTNSLSNFQTKTIIKNSDNHISEIKSTIDSKGTVHIVFFVQSSTEQQYFYWNSLDNNVIDLSIGGYEDVTSIDIFNDILYI